MCLVPLGQRLYAAGLTYYDPCTQYLGERVFGYIDAP